ncbi:hypothetical protein [Campylobacter sp. RM16192]|uniref:hypothetical protein n=1 Tax=Campylobacter sp. RM16192 TaxID=1660080 RepID=UPI001452022B|nr:hypothetical protein [Campylobacter sp. RM16192]QCD53467.1 hypothetical protein CDOMC_1888 [Campylobacter sp. RM16192]
MSEYERLKPLINRDVVASIIISCGYCVDRSYKFKIRDERTPSASIDRNGYVKDFGGSFGGDIFAFLNEVAGYTKQEALQIVKYSLGVE